MGNNTYTKAYNTQHAFDSWPRLDIYGHHMALDHPCAAGGCQIGARTVVSELI